MIGILQAQRPASGLGRYLRGEKGQSLVELALVLPLLLAMVFGIIDAGWMGYQAAAFNYSYANASWDIVSSSIVDYDYQATGRGLVPDSVASDAIKDSIAKSALPGYDADSVTVVVHEVSLENQETSYTIPDRNGNEAPAARVQRSLSVSATVTFTANPLVGFSLFPTTVEKELEFTRIVGVEHRE